MHCYLLGIHKMQHNIQFKINHHIPGLVNQSCELFKFKLLSSWNLISQEHHDYFIEHIFCSPEDNSESTDASKNLLGKMYCKHCWSTSPQTYTSILPSKISAFTSSCISGLAPAARRSSITLWWPLKLAAHSGVWPFYSECMSDLQHSYRHLAIMAHTM